jgi:hypothetical protein
VQVRMWESAGTGHRASRQVWVVWLERIGLKRLFMAATHEDTVKARRGKPI